MLVVRVVDVERVDVLVVLVLLVVLVVLVLLVLVVLVDVLVLVVKVVLVVVVGTGAPAVFHPAGISFSLMTFGWLYTFLRNSSGCQTPPVRKSPFHSVHQLHLSPYADTKSGSGMDPTSATAVSFVSPVSASNWLNCALSGPWSP